VGLFRRQDFRVESFEHVAVGDDLVLLRLAGRWAGSPPRDAKLVAITPAGREELPALPEPPSSRDEAGRAGPWRGAFSARRELLRAELRLEASDRRPVPLPAPRAHGARPAPERRRPPLPAARIRRPAPLVEPSPRRLRPDADDELRRAAAVEAGLREQLRETVAEAADFMRRLEGYEERREKLDAELGWERLLHKETRRAATAAEHQRDEAQALLQRERAERDRLRREAEGRAVALEKAERRLARVTGEVERERRARMDAEATGHARVQRLKVQHDRAREELVRARTRVAAGSPERAEELERRLARRDAALTLARERLGTGTRDLERIERRLAELRDRARAQPAAAGPAAAQPARVQSSSGVRSQARSESPPRSSARSPASRPPDRRFARDHERLAAIREDAERGIAKLAALERRIAELRDAIDPSLAGALPSADASGRKVPSH
jgi:hypothetical protein